MKNRSKIGLNKLSQVLIRLFRKDDKEDSFVMKSYGDTEDNFVEMVNEKLEKSFPKRNSETLQRNIRTKRQNKI